jgi:branched-chain amino acid transport system permease protein
MDSALFLNAVVAGLLPAGFYRRWRRHPIPFGMLDVVNIAHPGFIILGSYVALMVHQWLGVDPIAISVVLSPLFFVLGMVLYRVFYLAFERRGQESLRGLAFFFGILFITEVVLIRSTASTTSWYRLQRA